MLTTKPAASAPTGCVLEPNPMDKNMVRLWLASAALLTMSLAVACLWRTETFILDSSMKPGWIVVVMEDSRCVSTEGRIFRIPASGYQCTSLPLNRGFVIDRFFLEFPDGTRRKLKIDKEIFQLGNTMYSFGNECQVLAKTFFYGPEGHVTGDSSTVIRANRKECQATP